MKFNDFFFFFFFQKLLMCKLWGSSASLYMKYYSFTAVHDPMNILMDLQI